MKKKRSTFRRNGYLLESTGDLDSKEIVYTLDTTMAWNAFMNKNRHGYTYIGYGEEIPLTGIDDDTKEQLRISAKLPDSVYIDRLFYIYRFKLNFTSNKEDNKTVSKSVGELNKENGERYNDIEGILNYRRQNANNVLQNPSALNDIQKHVSSVFDDSIQPHSIDYDDKNGGSGLMEVPDKLTDLAGHDQTGSRALITHLLPENAKGFYAYVLSDGTSVNVDPKDKFFMSVLDSIYKNAFESKERAEQEANRVVHQFPSLVRMAYLNFRWRDMSNGRVVDPSGNFEALNNLEGRSGQNPIGPTNVPKTMDRIDMENALRQQWKNDKKMAILDPTNDANRLYNYLLKDPSSSGDVSFNSLNPQYIKDKTPNKSSRRNELMQDRKDDMPTMDYNGNTLVATGAGWGKIKSLCANQGVFGTKELKTQKGKNKITWTSPTEKDKNGNPKTIYTNASPSAPEGQEAIEVGQYLEALLSKLKHDYPAYPVNTLQDVVDLIVGDMKSQTKNPNKAYTSMASLRQGLDKDAMIADLQSKNDAEKRELVNNMWQYAPTEKGVNADQTKLFDLNNDKYNIADATNMFYALLSKNIIFVSVGDTDGNTNADSLSVINVENFPKGICNLCFKHLMYRQEFDLKQTDAYNELEHYMRDKYNREDFEKYKDDQLAYDKAIHDYTLKVFNDAVYNAQSPRNVMKNYVNSVNKNVLNKIGNKSDIIDWIPNIDTYKKFESLHRIKKLVESGFVRKVMMENVMRELMLR